MSKSYDEITFNSFEDFHLYIAKDHDLEWDVHLPSRLKWLGDKLEEEDLKIRCQYELDLFSFSIENGEVTSKVTHVDGSKYPDFGIFKDNLLYLKQRAKEEENSKYKAYYNHLLWKSPAKHGSFAKTATDHYILFLSKAIPNVKDNSANRAFKKCFKNLMSLSQEIGYRKEEVLKMLLNILWSEDRVNGYQKCSMMKYVAKNGKQIERSYLQSFFEYGNHVIDNNLYPDFQSEYLYLQILLSQKLNSSTKVYHEKLGSIQLKEAARHDKSFVVHDFYLKAILHYRKAGNKQKVEEISLLIENAKKNINFPKVELGGNDEKLNEIYRGWINVYDKVTDELMGQPPESIYAFLIVHDIFPKAETFRKVVRTASMDIFNTMSFDLNKNINKKKKGIGLSPYHLQIQNTSWNILWMIFLKGIKCGKISFETLKDFLTGYTWYGQNSENHNTDDDGNFNWLEILTPSLKHFFDNIVFDIEQKKTTPENYILAIDSLVLKFEGLIREFSRRIGAQTIDFEEDATKERISFDKLLDNPKLQSVIPADDIAFFKYLFTNEGINLRNNIAHCFYPHKKYNPAQMVLVITAVLRLGNYEFNLS